MALILVCCGRNKVVKPQQGTRRMFSIALKSPAALGLIQPLAATQTRPLMKSRKMCYPRWSEKLVLGLPVQSSAWGLGGGGCENTLLMRC